MINGIFPIPIYVTNRDSAAVEEEKEIEDIIEEELHRDGVLDYHTNNTYIFDTKLKNLKEFCEQQIKIYVKEIINPKEELDFYITQSWLNVVEPGGSIKSHYHSNSIISGAYYVSTEEGDNIAFYDRNNKAKEVIKFESKESNVWNSGTCVFPVNNNKLLLFPSWLDHAVEPNEKATTDRISISFNTFARGIFGEEKTFNELILE